MDLTKMLSNFNKRVELASSSCGFGHVPLFCAAVLITLALAVIGVVSIAGQVVNPPYASLPTKASVSVEVLDQNGDAVAQAKVVLMHAATGEVLDKSYTDSTGEAFFSNVVDFGTEVYAHIEIDGYAPYDTGPLPAETNIGFMVLLSKKAQPLPSALDISKITIVVDGPDKNPISGASVMFVSDDGPAYQMETDASGRAVAEIARNATGVRVRVTKEGYNYSISACSTSEEICAVALEPINVEP